jgi:butyryl-CoA dehydrogenase
MRFEPTETQAMIRDTARDFAEREVAPGAAARDEAAEYPVDIVRQMGDLGFLGIAVPEEWGGAGFDHVSYVLAMEEVSRACASTAVIMSVNNSLVCDPLTRFATDEQKRRWLAPLAKGDLLGCFALSEPASGSDAAGMETVAVRDGDSWVLNGSKNFITNAPSADVCILFAITDREAGHRGITAFLVPHDTTGVSIAEHDRKMGITAAWSSPIFLEDVRLPHDAVLGLPGDGFKVAMGTLDGGRIGIAAQAVGIARAAFEESRQYSTERQAFGAPIARLQAIQFMLADMAMEIDAARLLTLSAAWRKDQGLPYGKEAAMAKLYASEMSGRVTDKAIQIHGGYGYLRDFAAERHLRDARITQIYEGTSEIQRIVVARSVLKENAI